MNCVHGPEPRSSWENTSVFIDESAIIGFNSSVIVIRNGGVCVCVCGGGGGGVVVVMS